MTNIVMLYKFLNKWRNSHDGLGSVSCSPIDQANQKSPLVGWLFIYSAIAIRAPTSSAQKILSFEHCDCA